MSSRRRGEPTDECFIALVLLIGPFAFVLRWLWRWLKQVGTRSML